MRTPFGYFGDKWHIAPAIWKRLGDPDYYYEPFAGVLGCLLRRPTPGKYEFVGDINAHITNFLRAAKWAEPNELAQWADWPHSSLDMKARSKWLMEQKNRLHQNLLADADWYDAKAAGWYAWLNSVRINNQGGCLQLGRRKGVRRKGQHLPTYFTELAERLKDVTIFYGDWTHLANAAVTTSGDARNTAILLDPPYPNVKDRLYDHHDRKLLVRCQEFALAFASPSLKVALCGYEGDLEMPGDWEELSWGSQTGRGRERIWFSPHCLHGDGNVPKAEEKKDDDA
jgi:site-specific DNA-adenine methylase